MIPFQNLSAYIFIATIKIRKNSEQSKNSNYKIQQRLWFGFDQIVWYETGDFWNRQSEKSNYTIPSIFPALHSEKIDYVPNWKLYQSQFWMKMSKCSHAPS